jgi:hypothetical protein
LPSVLTDLKWNSASTEIAFNFKSARTPNDVYSINVETGKQEVWSRSVTNGVDTEKFALPELIQWTHPELRIRSGRTEPLTAADLNHLTLNNCAYLEYVVSKEHVYVFVLTRKTGTDTSDLKVVTLPHTAADLADKTNLFHQ